MQKPQLFLLHFAGGNSYSYKLITPHLSDFEAIPLELPGRGKRMREPLITDFESAAFDLYTQIRKKLSGENFVIYGHSLGACLAPRICELLEQDGKEPVCMVVTGNPGPGINILDKLHPLDYADFAVALKKLGGVPPELLEDKELFDFFYPIIKADFKIAEENYGNAAGMIKAPVYAVMGDKEDEKVNIENWSKYTVSGFKYEILEGDHFFIHRHPERIAAIIRSWFAAYKRSPVI